MTSLLQKLKEANEPGLMEYCSEKYANRKDPNEDLSNFDGNDLLSAYEDGWKDSMFHCHYERLLKIIEIQQEALEKAADWIGRCMCTDDDNWRFAREALDQVTKLAQGGGE